MDLAIGFAALEIDQRQHSPTSTPRSSPSSSSSPPTSSSDAQTSDSDATYAASEDSNEAQDADCSSRNSSPAAGDDTHHTEAPNGTPRVNQEAADEQLYCLGCNRIHGRQGRHHSACPRDQRRWVTQAERLRLHPELALAGPHPSLPRVWPRARIVEDVVRPPPNIPLPEAIPAEPAMLLPNIETIATRPVPIIDYIPNRLRGTIGSLWMKVVRQCVTSGTAPAWKLLFAFPKLILARTSSGSVMQTIKERLQLFCLGRYLDLWNSLPGPSDAPPTASQGLPIEEFSAGGLSFIDTDWLEADDLPPEVVRRAMVQTERGYYSKAVAALSAARVAECSPANVDTLQRKHIPPRSRQTPRLLLLTLRQRPSGTVS